MEDKRPFAAVRIGMSSAEQGPQRFSQNGLTQLPTVALWRVNLTALSQERNLYFVATGDKVCVYEPDFPFQTQGREPCLVITPRLAKEDALGFISPRHPHCINHLILGNLGHQEILLFSTDSGNVVAYYTASIYHAILRRPRAVRRDAQVDYFTLRPFFSQWVHESAWGLAIHSAGRMIAVSANTPYHVHSTDACSKITVFAFALCTPDSQHHIQVEEEDLDNTDPPTASDWTLWNSQSSADTPTRDRNYKIVLAGGEGHSNNIPCVTFVCENQDSNGSWLMSTDIHGEVKMWRIWRRKCHRTWSLANPGTIGTGWLRPWEAGWIIAALDIRSFRSTSGDGSLNALIGHKSAPRYQGHKESGPSWDLSNIARHRIPSNSLHHPTSTDVNDEESETERDSFHSDLSDSDVTGDEDQVTNLRRHATELNSASTLFSRPYNGGRRTRTAGRGSMHDDNDTEPGMLTDSDEDDEEDEGPYEDAYFDDVSEEDLNDLEVQFDSDLSDEDISGADEHGGSSPSGRSTTSVSSHSPLDDQQDVRISGDAPSPERSRQSYKKSGQHTQSSSSNNHALLVPNIPFLHCSTSQLSLFNGTESKSPHLFCAKLLKQTLPHEMEGSQLANMDRLNMIAQIPELGIVIIATQMGRCVVCTLTKRESDGALGLRFDWTLPTGKEERAGIRPPQDPLLGIAVSPIQGRFSRRTSSSFTNDSKENWAQDRVINGTPTTFDPRMVDLDASPRDGSDGDGLTSSGNDEGIEEDGEDGQNLLDAGQAPLSSQKKGVATKPYNWPRRKRPESWRVAEPSRRYRLMMTYANMTVLTYELARGIEREDTDAPMLVT